MKDKKRLVPYELLSPGIENWIYAIGKGRWEKPDRKHGVERERLAACLWHNLSGGGNVSGFIIQQALNERANSLGSRTREWMDEILAMDHSHE